jgi:hypothetical protein
MCYRYKDTLDEPTRMGMKRGLHIGLGAGTTWLIIFIARAITFWYGINLILEDRYKDVEDRIYTPGIILVVCDCGPRVCNVLFCSVCYNRLLELTSLIILKIILKGRLQ